MIKDYDKLPSRGKECSDGEKTRNCGCGSRAYVFYNENSRYSVECESCGELVNFKTLSHDMAIKMWNDMPTSIGRTTSENRKPKMCLVEDNYYNELKTKADKWDEKETPKEVIDEDGITFSCPTCYADNSKWIDWSMLQRQPKRAKVCQECGQKLDWEEQE